MMVANISILTEWYQQPVEKKINYTESVTIFVMKETVFICKRICK